MSRRGNVISHVSTSLHRLIFVLPQPETSPVPLITQDWHSPLPPPSWSGTAISGCPPRHPRDFVPPLPNPRRVLSENRFRRANAGGGPVPRPQCHCAQPKGV
jgi:hypothetical protein